MSQMKVLDIMIQRATKPIHDQLVTAQQDIRKLKDAGNADHRLILSLQKTIEAQGKFIKRMREL